MGLKYMFIGAGLVIIVGVLGYVRLAPSEMSRWHVASQITADKNFKSGVKRLVETGPDGLERFDKLARGTVRTTVLAGSVSEGLVTYVTRSKIFGFPDYTTVQQDQDQLKIYARLRFGRSDIGVNRARVGRWLDALQAR
ncbi:MAG: DUF1499 domain-containing protein [Rhodobacteraceae bacterium]|nr:DUF1499 domain-containing protein [Paracoccaceae bacterium]